LLLYYYAICSLKVSSLLGRGLSAVRLSRHYITVIQSDAFAFSINGSKLVKPVNDEVTKHLLVVSHNTQLFTVCQHFRVAVDLIFSARLSYNKDTSLSRLLIETSKIYLHSALHCTSMECNDFHIMSRSLLNVLQACLYLSTEQRKLAFIYSQEICSTLQTHRSQFNHVERQFLPCFDKTLETILGLILLYQHLQCSTRDRPRRDQRVDIFTVDLLGLYLLTVHSDVTCFAIFCRSRRELFSRYKECMMKKSDVTIADFLLFHGIYRNWFLDVQRKVLLYSSSHKCRRHVVSVQTVHFNTSRLRRLLVQYAVKQLTAFRVSMSSDFSSVRQVVTTDFEAMFAYKSHLYDKCFRLCKENIDWLLHVDAGSLTQCV
jgi:hypothetical protein